ncbi:MAG: phosphatase domain-containing protein [Planctomycetia bacterium]
MIVFFPTYATREPEGGRWRAVVAGMVTRPLPLRSRRRTMAMAVLKRLLDLDEEQADSSVFQRRAEAFLFQRVAGQSVRVAVGGRVYDVGQTDRTGHFQAVIDVDDAQVHEATSRSGPDGRWIAYEGLTPDGDEAETTPTPGGRVHLVDAAGLSVISDIDDTVKETNVANRRELLANTFIREFRAVPGIVDIYRDWQARGTAFHYVSASPWQLAECLEGFLGTVGLPAGSLHLKLFRLKDSTPLGRLPSRKRSKRRTVERIMEEFPGRRFLLVGDSGERDPEVYAAVAKRRGEQVAGIVIRQVDGKASREKIRSRLDRLARRLPAGCLTVFTDPDELAACFRAARQRAGDRADGVGHAP